MLILIVNAKLKFYIQHIPRKREIKEKEKFSQLNAESPTCQSAELLLLKRKH